LRFYPPNEVARSEGDGYRARYANLVRNSHNWLRVTRVLKCLGEVGLEHVQLGLCLHLARELCAGENDDAILAKSIGLRRAAHTYWFHTLRDSDARETLRAELAAPLQPPSFESTKVVPAAAAAVAADQTEQPLKQA
jgi:hypothetical protein